MRKNLFFVMIATWIVGQSAFAEARFQELVSECQKSVLLKFYQKDTQARKDNSTPSKYGDLTEILKSDKYEFYAFLAESDIPEELTNADLDTESDKINGFMVTEREKQNGSKPLVVMYTKQAYLGKNFFVNDAIPYYFKNEQSQENVVIRSLPENSWMFIENFVKGYLRSSLITQGFKNIKFIILGEDNIALDEYLSSDISQ